MHPSFFNCLAVIALLHLLFAISYRHPSLVGTHFLSESCGDIGTWAPSVVALKSYKSLRSVVSAFIPHPPDASLEAEVEDKALRERDSL